MSCFDVKILDPNINTIEIETCIGDQPASIDILTYDNTSLIEVNHCVALLPSEINDLITVKDILAGSGINVADNSGIYTISLSNPTIYTSGIIDFVEGVQDIIGNSGLVSGSYISLSYNDNSGLTTISATGLQPSGNYSVIGHSHSAIDITDFDSSVSGLLPVKNITSGSGISVSNNSGDFTISVTGSFGLTGEQVDDRVNDLLKAGSYINLNYDDNSDSLTISATGLQPSGNYSLEGHTHNISDINNLQNELDNKQPSGIYASGIHYHTSSDITDFSSAVSGLLPVKNISSGSGIGISSVSGDFTISVTGQFGLTGEEVDDRVNDLLIGGSYISLNYNDNLNSLTINATGLQPSGNYSLEGHTHVIADVSGLQNALDNKQPSGSYASSIHNHITSDITDFSSGVSGLLPSINGSGYVSSTFNNNIYTISVSGLQPSGNYANSVHTHSYTDITNFASGIDQEVSTLLVGGSYINLNYDNVADTLTISATGLQPSGNYSVLGHTHSSSEITNFNSSVSGLLPVKNIVGGTSVNVSRVSGEYTISVTGVAASSASSLITSCHNLTGSTIPKMSAVYINGGHGNEPTITLAIASGEATSSKTFGLTMEDITDNHSGDVVVAGSLIDVNTSQFGVVEGTTLYLSPSVSGALTTTKPLAPNHLVSIGKIVRNHTNQGIIQVSVQNGFELYELHDVAVTGVADGQFLQRNNGLWVPSSSGNFTSLTVNGTGVSLSGHTHTSSNITDFNSSVSGLLPVTNIVAGSNVTISSVGTVFTISSTGGGGGDADEIEEYVTYTSLPTSGNINILYRTTDDGRLYQWSGSVYAEIGPDSVTTGSHSSQHYTNGTDPILNVVSRPAILTANVNNYAHNNADIVYINADANRIITGLVAAVDGTVKLLINASLYTITLDHQDVASNPENRFMVPFGSDYVLQPGYSITVVYDGDALRWRILA